MQNKDFVKVLQLLFSLYKLFILPNIPFKIILKNSWNAAKCGVPHISSK